MSSKSDTDRVVRQRANFICQSCHKIADCQYAHIIPKEWKGPYIESNLLFLCYQCHRALEVAGLIRNTLRAQKLIERMYKLQKNIQQDERINSNFEFYSNNMTIHLNNGLKIINTPIIIYYTGEKSKELFPLLSIKRIKDEIMLSGFFFDEKNRLLLEIYDNQFTANSGTLWDLQIKRRSYLRLTSKSTQINLELSQNDDGSLKLLGVLYFFGKKYDLSDNFVGPNKITFNQCVISDCYKAIRIDEFGISAIG